MKLARAKSALRDVTLGIIDRMMKSLDGRELVVPLSAGRDSRLIVSAIHHLGYRNVRCFAYGRPGNFEAQASKAIAEKLGFKWRFVPIGTGFMRRYFGSDIHTPISELIPTRRSRHRSCKICPKSCSLRVTAIFPPTPCSATAILVIISAVRISCRSMQTDLIGPVARGAHAADYRCAHRKALRALAQFNDRRKSRSNRGAACRVA